MTNQKAAETFLNHHNMVHHFPEGDTDHVLISFPFGTPRREVYCGEFDGIKVYLTRVGEAVIPGNVRYKISNTPQEL